MNKTPYNSPAHQDTQKQHKVHINQIKVLEKNTACYCLILNVKCLRQLKYINVRLYIFISEMYMMLISSAYGNFNINNVHIYQQCTCSHAVLSDKCFSCNVKISFFKYKFIGFFNFIKQLTTFLWQILNLRSKRY